MKYASGIRFFIIVITAGLSLTCVASVVLIDRSIALARESISFSIDAEMETLERYLVETGSDDLSFGRSYFDFISKDSSLLIGENAFVSSVNLPDGSKIYFGRSAEDFEKINFYKNTIIAALAGIVVLSLISVVLFTRENVMKPFKIMGDLTGTSPEPEELIENMRSIINDLEEKKNELENLYSAEKNKARDLALRSRAVIQSLEAGIIDVDAEANIIQANQGFFNISGEHELSGNLINSRVGENIKSAIFDCLKDKKSTKSRLEIRGRIIDEIVSPVLESERIVGAVAVFYDITDTVLLERMLSTREKMLSLSEISAGVSHEFRNSAGVLIALASAIYQKQSDENAKMLLEETKSLVGIIENFSELARKKDKSFAEFDLKKMTDEIKKYYNWNFKTDIRHFMFMGDRDLIRRALINVLQNSVEASRNRESEILVKADKLNSWQRIEITDKAGGMNDEDLEKIKAPFFSSKKEGIGLGLSIVEKIMQMHKGSLEIKNFDGGLKVTMSWSCGE
ncbi:GHKL domain-containing protein [candidate division WOR-3 bacterium]|nr:GHKL domain-containing protein [candidate division WOR-3 bacterium]